MKGVIKKVKNNSLNLFSLIAIQGSNAVLPLLVFPFVLSKIGSDNYSEVVVSEAIMFIIYAFVLYSFEVNGVSKAVNLITEKDYIGLSHLFTKVLLVRLLIFLLGVLVVLCSYFFVSETFFILLLTWMLYPLSFIFQSSYFYLALEKNFDLAIVVVLSRILCLGLIYYFINESSNNILIPIIIGGTYFIGGIVSFLVAIYKYKITLLKVNKKEIKQILLEGKEIFLGNISVLLFRDFNVLLLGMLTQNSIAISSYSIAEKIIKSLQASIRPLNQFFFPKGVKLLKGYTDPNRRIFFLIGKVTIIQLLALLFIVTSLSLSLYLFKDSFVTLRDYPNINLIISFCSIMVGSIFFGVMNFMYGTLGLNHLNGKKYFAFSIFLTGIISVTLSFFLIRIIDGYGAAISFIAAELVLFIFVVKRYFFVNHITKYKV